MKSKFYRFLALALCAALAFTALPMPVLHAATTGSIATNINVDETATVDNGTATFLLRSAWTRTFTSGSSTNQASKIYQDTVTLAGSGTSTIDLDSTLTCNIGTCSFTRIYGIFIQRTDAYVASTQDENLTIGGDFILTKYLLPGGDTLSGVTIPIGPYGIFSTIFPGPTGVAVTATTGDQITITNASSADSCSYVIVVLGS